ncbi:MAG: nickel-responsive transcriptional regulator NikR [Bacteroidetes bacterium]|nr:nickel-responsive transcriptional regulator NikR [Bacteroidota bacterium]
MSVTRFGISIEQPLLEALDEYVKENFFTNRSQAIRQLISKNIVEKKWQCNNQVAGAITLLYDPKKREILNLIASELEKFHSEVLSSQRFMLEPDKWLEVVTVKGTASRLTELSDTLISIKGLYHGKLSMSRAD